MNLCKWSMSLCLLMALASCSKDLSNDLSEGTLAESGASASREEATQTREIMINLTADKDSDNELRAVYGADTSDEMGRLLGLEMPEKDVILRVAVKQGDGQPIVQDLTFKKTLGRNHASYSGKIMIPLGGTGGYKIAAVLKAEVGGATFLNEIGEPFRMQVPYVNSVVMKTSDNKVALNIPYVTAWQDLAVNSDTAEPVNLTFYPQGTVIRMRIYNNSELDKTFYSVKFLTSAFVGYGSFHLNQQRDNYPVWSTENYQTILYKVLGE